MRKFAIGVAALGLAAVLGTDSEARVEVGVLECNVEGGVGLIVGSQKRMACRFKAQNPRFSETYYGKVTRVGLDVGVTGKQVMVWAVYAPTDLRRRGALAGAYAGVSGEISAGAGAGANALLGGSDRTVTLQPVSIQAQMGVNVALGIAGLELFAPEN